MKFDLDKEDLCNLIEGLGHPIGDIPGHPFYQSNSEMCEEYGLIEYWSWNVNLTEKYTEDELWSTYQELKALYKRVLGRYIIKEGETK